MNIHAAREALAAELDDITPEGWQTSTETSPSIYSGLIHIGHAQTIKPDTMRTYGVDLAVTVWADETGDREAASKLYELLSPGEFSIVKHVARPGSEITFTSVSVGPVGPRDEGPSGYLAADLIIRVQV